jgi:hypothetical protein
MHQPCAARLADLRSLRQRPPFAELDAAARAAPAARLTTAGNSLQPLSMAFP